MRAGKVTAVRTVLGLIAGLGVILGVTSGLAQTPDEACAADSLYLVSPDVVEMHQQVVGRPGLVLSWADLPTSEATCYTLTGVDTLGFSVTVEGGFGDQVDRMLAFSTPDSGVVGHHTSENLFLSWQSQGNSINGVLAGDINLANNGGLLYLDPALGTWDQANNGLPMAWFKTNLIALGEGSGGFLVASITSGSTQDSDSQGLWVLRNGSWARVAEEIFPNSVLITQIVVSPDSNDDFAVGTGRDGLFVTHDGGSTFTRFTSELDPDFPDMPANFLVKTLNWDSSRLWTFLPNFGLFVSADNAASFQRSDILVADNLDNPTPSMELPLINEICVDPADSDHVLAALNFHGIWETDDGGLNWHDLYGDLNVPDPDEAGQWSHSAKTVAIDPNDSQIIVAGIVQEGLYRTTDGGNTWSLVGEDVQPSGLSSLRTMFVRCDPGTPGLFYAFEDRWSLLQSADSGATWDHAPEQPFINRGLQLLVSRDGTGKLLLASWGGGIYEPGTPINLSDTYNSGTSSYLRDLDLGLDITFQVGSVERSDSFNLVCQTFQGWAVWRSPGYDRYNMTLLGLYDRVNPESCIEGYCGDLSYDLLPQCYVSKRAACFKFDTPDTIRFFDDEVYNGFSYFYAVSTFDYGNTAMTTPENNTNSMVFSARFHRDPNSPFAGEGNISGIQINSNPADPVDGEEIYVYPNPLRRGDGIPGAEGETVIFTNLPPQSRVRVFTTAGDDVINLGWDNMHAGNIYWRTINRDGEEVSPGVYLFKVESPGREDYWGKLVIIR